MWLKLQMMVFRSPADGSLCDALPQHHLCLDNCHSHVALALNLMRYDNSSSWNMVNLCVATFIHGRHTT